jgi:HD-GYP domain-containing protein (c-di-GMP phosphodiesterase class II)
MDNSISHIKKLTQIGIALSAEKNLDRLLEMIVEEARQFTQADGGTLYIRSDDETQLHFSIIQNETLNVHMGGTSGAIIWPPVDLKNSDGSPNYANVSAYVALSGEVVNIPDVYDAKGFNFEGTRKFDAKTRYRSKSMLVVPMRNHENDIIGVLQLLNALNEAGDVIPFPVQCQGMTESLASQAAVALTNKRLIYDLEVLLESFIKTIAAGIDEKSKYTGDHIRRVAELTMEIAKKINEATEGPYVSVYLDEDKLKELRIAAWLHDIGKVTTPEYVVDKATKLETIFDRIELLRTRFEIIKRDREIEHLKTLIKKGNVDPADVVNNDKFFQEMEQDLEFLARINMGSEFVGNEMMEKLKRIAQKQWSIDGKKQTIINENELYNLSIRNGTLTAEERNIINNHVVITYKMLSQLPFPKKLKHVPDYAAAHHERLNGTGYPFELKGDQLSLQARILAFADIFEALTAKDRPYKKGKTLSEAVKIMAAMVADGHLDADLFKLFMDEKIYLDYARKELSPQQVDEVNWAK